MKEADYNDSQPVGKLTYYTECITTYCETREVDIFRMLAEMTFIELLFYDYILLR